MGTLLWKDRITESVEERNSSFTIRLMVPVVWMISLDKKNKDEKREIRKKIEFNLSKIIERQPAWDTKLYNLLTIDVGSLKKDFVEVTVILEKKVL